MLWYFYVPEGHFTSVLFSYADGNRKFILLHIKDLTLVKTIHNAVNYQPLYCKEKNIAKCIILFFGQERRLVYLRNMRVVNREKSRIVYSHIKQRELYTYMVITLWCSDCLILSRSILKLYLNKKLQHTFSAVHIKL